MLSDSWKTARWISCSQMFLIAVESRSFDVLLPCANRMTSVLVLNCLLGTLTETIVLAPHCPLDPIALAARMQLATATPNFAIQGMSLGIHYSKMRPLGTGTFDLNTYLKDPSVFEVNDGYVHTVSHWVGLGIEVDEVRKISNERKT